MAMEGCLANVAVIGGGLGGCAVALALSQSRVRVTIYEARSENERSNLSGVLLTPNGLHVLDKLGVLARIKSKCHIPTHRVFRNDKDEIVSKTPIVDGDETGYTNHRVWRAVLLDEMKLMLNEGIFVRFYYDSKFTRIISDSEDGVMFQINDQIYSASMLIGADGLYSKVRNHLSPGVEPVYTGKRSPCTLENAISADDSTGTLGVIGHLDTSKIHWPPSAGKERNCTIQSEAGAMFWMAEDASGESAMYAMQVSYPNQTDLKALANDPDRILSFWTEKYDRWGPTARAIIDGLREHKRTLFIWPYMKMPPLPHWYSPTTGRIIIIGDGAHALPPSSAQGVNGALEDSYSLTLLLDSLQVQSAGRERLLQALSSWQQWRQDKVDAIYEYTSNTVDVKRLSEAERQKRISEGQVKNVAQDGMGWLFKPDIEGTVRQLVESICSQSHM